ncbi:uracil-DNA glycosylase [Paenibacillus sp. R14(2021)]|uniref:uracil-DNA glycosylase n=1 Tax=Paenibacillus sp. R14(2021) TaxID=2859228 RepID=UPI001C6147DF|nr:uracil-DNA glycosylase [Paenibacillus sp. R14(2021)]
MKPSLMNDWKNVLRSELDKPYFHGLLQCLTQAYEEQTIYPAQPAIFNALHYTSYADVKVVILGQDPYHGPGQAHGLSFSVLPGVKTPPSLKNIYNELHADLGYSVPDHGCLVPWAQQGVLLLNNVLTVREGEAASHQGIGWERFTDAVIAELNKRERPIAFVLWGKHAQEKAAAIDSTRHRVLESPHPSPLSARRGFFGSRPFSKVNAWLQSVQETPIDWRIPPLAELEAAAAGK